MNDWERITSAPMDAGTYRVTATVATDGNYKEASSTPVEFTITKANSSISVTENLGRTYDGTAVTSTPTVSKTRSTGAVTYTWEKKKSVNDWERIAFAPTDAGTYRVTATVAADANFKEASSTAKEFTITKANSTIFVTANLDKIYNGTAVSNTPTIDNTGSTGAVTYTWEKKKNDGSWESITSAPTDAGTYRVTATVASDGNHKEASSTAKEFTITKANSTIFVTANLDKIYNGTAVNNTPTVDKTGSTGAVTYTWEKKKNATEWDGITSVPTDAGTYRVTATVAADDNYKEVSSTPVEFTISKADSSISVTEGLGRTYNGTAVTSTPTVSKTGSTGIVTYTWEKKKIDGSWESIPNAPTDAGTYRVTATVAADANFKEASSTAKEFTITKANSSISVTESLGRTYDGTAVTSKPAVNKTGSTGAVTYTWEKKKNATEWDGITSAPTDAGAYRITATVASDGNHKEANSTPVEFTISKAHSTISVTESLDKDYDASAVTSTPAVNKTGSTGAVTYTWEMKKNDGSWESIASVPTEAGTYRVIAKVAGDDNYTEAVSIGKEFNIIKAENIWTKTLSVDDLIYGEDVKPSADSKFGAVLYVYSDAHDGPFTSQIPKEAGTWYVMAIVEETNNYGRLEAVEKFKIKKATASAIVLPDDLSGVQDSILSSVDLPKGWTWVKGDTVLKANNNGYQARYMVDDVNYDYTNVEGYSASGHYVEKTLKLTVAQGENKWEKMPAISDWTYGETASEPQGQAAHGTLIYSYSNAKDGTFTSDAPTDAGTWYMKASVAASSEYTGLSTVVEFTINQAIPSYRIPQDLNAMYGQSLKDVTLPHGFVWTDDIMNVGNVGKNIFTVSYIPKDRNYKIVSDISVTVMVVKAENELLSDLKLNSWSYGETPNKAEVEVRYGKARFYYSNSIHGTFTEEVPITAGIWYMKAVVEGTENYEGLESNVVSFKIEPKNVEITGITIPTLSSNDDPIVKDGDKELRRGTDYEITKVQAGDKVTITITFKGNYAGTMVQIYTIDDGNQVENKNHTVQTSDTSTTGLWAMLMTLAGGAIAMLKGKKNKEETEE